MQSNTQKTIQIDLERFTLQVILPGFIHLTLQFDTPSRRFYLSLMALVAAQMKQAGEISFVPLDRHVETLALLITRLAKLFSF